MSEPRYQHKRYISTRARIIADRFLWEIRIWGVNPNEEYIGEYYIDGVKQ